MFLRVRTFTELYPTLSESKRKSGIQDDESETGITITSQPWRTLFTEEIISIVTLVKEVGIRYDTYCISSVNRTES